MLEKVFDELGFSSKDLQVYLSLVSTTSLKASEIALYLELPKTSILESLYRLEKESLVSKVSRGNKFIFSAQNPEILKLKIKTKLELLSEIQNGLDQEIIFIKQKRLKKKFPKVKFFQGRSGIIQAYEETLKVGSKIYAYGNFNSAKDYLQSYLKEYWLKRTAKKINLTALVPDSYSNRQIATQTDNLYLRTSYFYPPNLSSSIEINVLENSVIFISFEEEIAVSIESKSIAESMTNLLVALKDKLPS